MKQKKQNEIVKTKSNCNTLQFLTSLHTNALQCYSFSLLEVKLTVLIPKLSTSRPLKVQYLCLLQAGTWGYYIASFIRGYSTRNLISLHEKYKNNEECGLAYLICPPMFTLFHWLQIDWFRKCSTVFPTVILC